MANPSIFAAFERMWQHVVSALGHKAEKDHDHNDTYYTEAEIDEQLGSVNAAIDNMANGTTPVQAAVKAEQDASGNVITDTYETKSDAQSKFAEVKEYTDTVISSLDEDYYTKTEIDNQMATKVNLNQGQEHASKVLTVGTDGALTPKANIVHVGSTEPADPDVLVWINTAEEFEGAVTLVPRLATIELAANKWVGTAEPYSQAVVIDSVITNSKIDLQPTAQQIVALQAEEIVLMAENNNGVITVYAIGGMPSFDMTMQVLITEVEVLA